MIDDGQHRAFRAWWHQARQRLPRLHWTSEMGPITDQLMDDFIFTNCIGKNDLAVVAALMTAAGALIAAHCGRKPDDDYDELVKLGHEMFDVTTKCMRP